MIRFSMQQLMQLHSLLIQETGGIQGIRDMDLLDSAICSSFQTIYGKEVYFSIEEKVARITWGIVANHGFSDGNKRMGILVMLMLLRINDIVIEYTQDELFQIGIGLANGDIKYDELLVWIEKHKQIKKFSI